MSPRGKMATYIMKVHEYNNRETNISLFKSLKEFQIAYYRTIHFEGVDRIIVNLDNELHSFDINRGRAGYIYQMNFNPFKIIGFNVMSLIFTYFPLTS